jgi:hypothetical protein
MIFLDVKLGRDLLESAGPQLTATRASRETQES